MKNKYSRVLNIPFLIAFFLTISCGNQSSLKEKNTKVSIIDPMKMAVKMAGSEMTFFEKCYQVDFDTAGKWNYTPGLVAMSMMELWKETGNAEYYEYAKTYADKFITNKGEIIGYKLTDYNIDKINSGIFLMDLYQKTGEEKYKTAVLTLREQLKTHPRTSEGGFWHKKRYPHQMWLDGLYMGSPFYARFAAEFNEPSAFGDIANQFVTVHKHTYDSVKKLNYHGWDESRDQKWADPKTGTSQECWGRGAGWFAMALVDVLPYFADSSDYKTKLIAILNQVAKGIQLHQDSATGLWYQVVDKGNMEGNYLEATASTMFVYTLLKATRLGYLDEEYKQTAKKGYAGIVKHLIQENPDGTINLTNCCAGAGLGGNPYRDGTYEYYMNETVRDNDPKGVGPFILASIEMSKTK